VVVDSVRNKTGSIEVLSDHEIFLDVVPKGSKEFPDITVSRYLTASAKNESSVIAEVLNSPVIAYNRTGNGKTVYIGIKSVAGVEQLLLQRHIPCVLAAAHKMGQQG